MFVGREKELENLRKLRQKAVASLVAVTGRRRIGKSRLLEEYAKEFARSFVFSGLPPAPGVKPEDQRADFSRRLRRYFSWPELKADTWADLFALLADQTVEGEVLVVLDEVSWMAQGDALFLPHLKNAWDLDFKKNANLVLAVCGSVSSWIEENLLSSTGFVGRVSETIRLRELPLSAAAQFWGDRQGRVSHYEKIKFLNIVGGIPRYLEEMQPAETSEQNILRLCFSESGFLFSEFDRLFSDLFSKRLGRYRRVLETLLAGDRTPAEIASSLGQSQGGTLTDYLEQLEGLDFVRRDYVWSLYTQQQGKLSRYRLSDNYARFFLRYIAPHHARIASGGFPDRGLQFIPGWETIMGLQFENLVLNNRMAIFDRLGVDARDVLADGPYFQTETKSTQPCQIDYLIQTRFNSLYLCEVKCRSTAVSTGVIGSVQEKMERLRIPKNHSVRPILISGGEVSNSLGEARYFARIITGEDLLAR